jgi:3-phenylpropionate/trans-cinnamate dioxygenase ferredoxin reductase subunit
MTHGMVIVGAGECGARAAFTLREAGYAGPVALIGEEPHLPYERPPLSKEAITAEEAPTPSTIATRERLAAASIEIIAQPAIGIDRRNTTVSLADGAAIPYEKLLLATGATPRRLSQAPIGVGYLRTFEDALWIRSRLRAGCRVVIIGGGFIGLELAASAVRRGAAVTIIEAQSRIMMRGVPQEIAASVEARHRSEGGDIRCGHGIVGMEAENSTIRVRTADGRVLTVDLCVIAIGAVPVTGLADAAGLDICNGIAVDEYLRTSDPDIFAAGDCCSAPLAIYNRRRVRLEAWRNAQEQGALAALNMLGGNQRHQAIPWFWSDQYEMTLYVAGLPDEGCTTVRRDLAHGAFLLFHLASDGRLVAASGIGRGNAVAKDIRLAEMLIARRAKPVPDQLTAPGLKLKTLLPA